MFGSCQSLAGDTGLAANPAGLPPGLDVNPAGLAANPAGVHAEIGLVWPVTLYHIHRPPPLRTGMSALIGRSAVVRLDVSASGGRSVSAARSGPPAPTTTGAWSAPQVPPRTSSRSMARRPLSIPGSK